MKTYNKSENTSEDTGVARKKVRIRTLRGRLLLMLGKVAIGISFCCAVAQGCQVLWSHAVQQAFAMREATIEYLAPVVPPEKEPSEEELSSLINRVSREKGIDPLILTVIAEKESAGGKLLYHFEPEKYQDISRQGKYAKQSDDERRMLSSSHGAFHVLGLSAMHFCSLHWSKLYQPLEGARCAALIVQTHWNDTASLKEPGDRVREVFRRYNGSGDRAEAYADDAMRKLANLLYKGMSKGQI